MRLEEYEIIMESWDSPPARHKVFAALNRPIRSATSGLTTPLPHHWEKVWTMVLVWVKTPPWRDTMYRGVFLRPMRIMSSSEYVELDIKGGDFELSSHR